MKNFHYTYYDKSARIKEGYLKAYTIDDAKSILRRQDITLINVDLHESSGKKAVVKEKTNPFKNISIFKKRLNYDDFIIFLKQFTVLIKAGVGVMAAIDIIAGQLKDKHFKDALIKASQAIYDGASLYSAFNKQDVFPKLFVNLLHLGEVSGDLPKILNDLSEYYEKEREMKKRAVASLTYPIIVMLIAIGGVVFLTCYIFPGFISIYKNFNMELPLPTKILVFTVNIVRNPFSVTVFVLTVIAGYIILGNYLQTPVGRYYYDKLLLYVPILKNIIKKMTIARFSRTLGTVYEDGLSLHRSMETAAQTVENTYYKEAFEKILKRVEDEGMLFSSGLAENRFLFPRIFVNLVAAGEETGDLGGMLKKVSDYFEEEVYYILDNMLNLIEPFVVIFLGVTVLFIMLSLFLPLYSLITQFSGS